MKKTWQFIKGRQFLPHYCKIAYTSFIKQKMNGKGGNGQPVTFTVEELGKIKRGIVKMYQEIIKEIDKAIEKASN